MSRILRRESLLNPISVRTKKDQSYRCAEMKYQPDSSCYRDSTSSMRGIASAFRACNECTRFCRSQNSHKRDVPPPVSRFVKILVGDDWEKVLLLPPAFAPTVEHLLGKITLIENSVGEKWTVKLSAFDNGRIGFMKGWNDFVMDHRLDGGDFLVFDFMKGSHFTVHMYGRTLCEKNCNGSFRKNHHKAQLRPCDRNDSGVKGKLLQSRFAASGSKSGPSVPQGVFKSSAAHTAQHSRGNHSMMNNSNRRSSSYFEEEHERRLASGSRKGIDGEMHASNYVHTDKRLQAKANSSKYRAETENLESNRIQKVTDRGQGQEDCNWTEKVMSKTYTKATHVSMAGNDHSYMGSMAEDKGDRIWTENVMSKTFTKGNQVTMTGKDRPLVFRDDLTHKYENKTSASRSSGIHFKHPGEEPSKKGNDRSSPSEDEGAVFRNRGHISTGNLKKIVMDELPERSEQGHYHAKRKRDEDAVLPSCGHIFTGNLKKAVRNELPEISELRHYTAKKKIGSYSGCSNMNLGTLPHGMTTMKQVKSEPCDSYSSDLSILTCSAATNGERLELPDKLPALRYLKRGGKAIFLRDRKNTMWPALYEERSGMQALTCKWEEFNPKNEVEAGDNYVITVEDAVQFIYKISVIRPV